MATPFWPVGATSYPEGNLLVKKDFRVKNLLPFQKYLAALQHWANWPAQAGRHKWAEKQEVFRLKKPVI